MRKFLSEMRFRITRNPVLIGAAVLWGYETLTTGDAITWRSSLAVAVGVLVRSKVVPAKEVEIITDFLGNILDSLDDDAKKADPEAL